MIYLFLLRDYPSNEERLFLAHGRTMGEALHRAKTYSCMRVPMIVESACLGKEVPKC